LAVSNTFAGFTSRCTIAWLCSTARASASGANVAAAAATAMRPSSMRSARVGPSWKTKARVGLAVVFTRVEDPDERRVVHAAEHRRLPRQSCGRERIFDAGAAQLQGHHDAVAIGAPDLGVGATAQVSLQPERTDTCSLGAPYGRTRPSSHSSHSLRDHDPTASAGSTSVN